MILMPSCPATTQAPPPGGRYREAEKSSPPPRLSRDLRVLVEDTVAGVFNVDAELLRQPTRGRANVALARQVAMYIAHIGYGLTLTEVGELFERDRTTVAHACSVVEQRRDDAHFDAAIHLLDLVIRILKATRRTAASLAADVHQHTAIPQA